MATASSSTSAALQSGRFLTFALATESYGIEVLAVQEIIRLAPITCVPQLPAHLRGVINLRGRIIPVLDLRIRFGFPPGDDTSRSCIVVVQLRSAAGRPFHMGLVVDAVEEVVHIAEADLSPPPEFGATVDTSFLLAIARVKGAVKTLLNIQRVLTEGQLAQTTDLVAA